MTSRPWLDEQTPSPNQAAKREAIIDAAVQVMLREGVAGCTVRAIADEAEVSKGSVHYYFADVDEILDRGMIQAVNAWIDWLSAEAEPEFWTAMSACLEPFAQGDRTLMPLWFEYWTVCTRTGRLDPLREMQGLLTNYVSGLLDRAGLADASDRAIGVTAYLFGVGMQQTIDAVDTSLIQGQLSDLTGLSLPSVTR